MRAPCLVLAIFLLAAAPAAAQAPRACTSAELAGVTKPLVVEERTKDRDETDEVVAGRRYRALVVSESADGDRRDAQDGSFAVTGPSGLTLTRDDVDERLAYAFTAPAIGPLTLTLSWLAEAKGDPTDVCAASRTLTVKVRRIVPVQVGKGRFLTARKGLPDAFTLGVTAPELADTSPVSLLVRLRKGTTRSPTTASTPTLTATLRPRESGGFDRGSGVGPHWLRSLDLHADLDERGVTVYPDPNIAFGTSLRFGFSIEVRQDGKQLGGYAGGAVCRRVQQPHFSVVRCRSVGLRAL